MYALTKLSQSTAAGYEGFTFSPFQPKLQTLEAQGATVAIGASLMQQPIGLALAEIQQDSKTANILSLFVNPRYRNLGIGTSLLTQLEETLSEKGCTKVEIVYMNGKPSTADLERLLQKLNWTPPQPRMLVCKSTIKKIAAAPWLYKYSLPPEFTLFPWFDLTPAQRQQIQQQQDQQQWYPEILSPFNDQSRQEPLNSLCLLYQKEVVGWMITHRIAPDTIRYTSLFIRQDLQKLGRAIPLLAEAIKRQVNSEILSGIWTVWLDNQPMVNFVKRRMAPYLISMTETKGAYKFLVSN
jgi:GNAT superfamily N-acetyltransferase